MDQNESPLFQFLTNFMGSVNEDPRILSILEARLQAKENMPNNTANNKEINKLTDILSRQEFIAVFRPTDVKALLFLRNFMNWRGHALLFIVPGHNAILRVTFQTLKFYQFSVFCFQLLYPGDMDPFGYVDGFGAHPFGFSKYINDNLAPTGEGDEGDDTAYAMGVNNANTMYHQVIHHRPVLPYEADSVPGPLREGTGLVQEGIHFGTRWNLIANMGYPMVEGGYPAYIQDWNQYWAGWNHEMNNAAGNDDLNIFQDVYGNRPGRISQTPFGTADNPWAFGGFGFERDAMMTVGAGGMNPNTRNPMHPSYNPFACHPKWR